MSITVNVAVHAILRDMTGRREKFPVSLGPGSRVSDVLRMIGLSEDDVGMVVVRGRLVDRDYLPCDGTEIDVFPLLSGG